MRNPSSVAGTATVTTIQTTKGRKVSKRRTRTKNAITAMMDLTMTETSQRINLTKGMISTNPENANQMIKITMKGLTNIDGQTEVV